MKREISIISCEGNLCIASKSKRVSCRVLVRPFVYTPLVIDSVMIDECSFMSDCGTSAADDKQAQVDV